MKKIFLIVIMLVSSFGFSQKIKWKKGIILVNDVEYALLKKDNVSSNYSFILSNLKGVELFFIKGVNYTNEINEYRFYYEIMSSNLEKKYFEIALKPILGGGNHAEYAIKALYNGDAINSDGTINNDKLDVLSKKVGFEYSKKIDALNNKQSSQTIIIQQPEPQRRSGVNINIGR